MAIGGNATAQWSDTNSPHGNGPFGLSRLPSPNGVPASTGFSLSVMTADPPPAPGLVAPQTNVPRVVPPAGIPAAPPAPSSSVLTLPPQPPAAGGAANVPAPVPGGPLPAVPQIAGPPPYVAPAPAFVDCPPAAPPCPEDWAQLAPYGQRAAAYPDREAQLPTYNDCVHIPPGYQPWWTAQVGNQTRGGSYPLAVDQGNLLLGAIMHSPDIQAVRADAAGRQAMVGKELGRFDWRAFAEANYDYTSDPVGNELTTGGPPRYRDRLWDASAGVRKETGWGGELEIAQKIGRQYNNSTFFIPEDQGQTRLEISYIQPLLGQAGAAYSQSRILLAQIDADVARHEVCQKLQDHLFQVSQAYWDVYRARVVSLQKQKLLDSAQTILNLLQARAEVDAVQRQILRAQAAVASRRSEILRAQAAIRNGESRLRLLVNDPRLIDGGRLELIPSEWPLPNYVPVSMRESLQAAVHNRPDVARATREIRAAGVRLGVAKNELLPKLDLILSTYVAGLEGDADIGQAFANQFGVGEPGFTLGLLFEIPLGNQTARGEYDRRQAEMARAVHEFRATVETGLTEVELAVREVETAYQEMASKYQAMVAANAEEEYLNERWRLLPGDERDTPNLLEDLLDSQERLAEEEASFVTAQVTHTLALMELKRATGTLMRFAGESCGP